MANKLTKRDYFNQILSKYPLTADETAFIEHELELLDRKNSGDRKETATQKANADLKAQILDCMASGTRYTVSEIGKLIGIASNQKVSALVRQLKMDNLIVRTEEKGKAYFTKA